MSPIVRQEDILKAKRLILALLTATLLFGATLTISQPQTAEAAIVTPLDCTPVNPNANGKTRAVLNLLCDLYSRPSNRVAVGQFGAFGDGETYELAKSVLDGVQSNTGRRPALTGMDLAAQSFNRTKWKKYITDEFNAGSIIVLSWHAPNPMAGNTNAFTFGEWESNGQSASVLLSNSPARDNWHTMLDQLATFFLELQNDGVSVIFRPYHEGNGNWFWWGINQTDVCATRGAGLTTASSIYAQIYQQTVDYIQSKGVNNVLWGFSPNYKWDQWACYVDDGYPGNNYVDINGYDIYYGVSQQNLSGSLGQFENYTRFTSKNKPMGIFEFGAIPASGDGWNSKTWAWTTLMDDISGTYNDIAFFQAWEWVFSLTHSQYTGQTAMVNRTWALTQDEMPGWNSITTPVPTATINLTTSPTPSATKTATPTATATGFITSGFFRGININGSGVTIGSDYWDGEGDVVTFSVNGTEAENPYMTINPATSAERETMLKSYRQHWAFNIALSGLDYADYQVALYFVQDWNYTGQQPVTIYVEGVAVETFTPPKTAGAWVKKGAYTVTVTDGTLNITTNGDVANLAGFELSAVSANASPTPSNTFTPSATSTLTYTWTPSPTRTITYTPSVTQTASATQTASRTNTATNTWTPTATFTATNTYTPSLTYTPSNTPVHTATKTWTPSRTPRSPIGTIPPTPTRTITATRQRATATSVGATNTPGGATSTPGGATNTPVINAPTATRTITPTRVRRTNTPTP